MNGESTYQQNFTVVDEEISNSNAETENNKQPTENAKTLQADFVLAPSEISLIQKKRHKLRIFDPKGIYTFKHIEISYFQSFLHTLSTEGSPRI
ncbi:MAG: hypothetical protein ACI92O_003086 [Colwellia sp.]|jgi:hypothetical protein